MIKLPGLIAALFATISIVGCSTEPISDDDVVSAPPIASEPTAETLDTSACSCGSGLYCQGQWLMYAYNNGQSCEWSTVAFCSLDCLQKGCGDDDECATPESYD